MADVASKVDQIRKAVYGKDVRESIASGIETMNAEVESTTARQNLIDPNENTRIANENTRVASEKTRVTSENNRISSENVRVSNENTRVTNNANMQVWEEYDGFKIYKPLNKVTYLGNSYVNIVQCQGVLPTDTSKWLMIAKKGNDGLGTILENTYTVTLNGVSNIPFGFTDFDPNKDSLLVYDTNRILLDKDINYSINTNNTSIDLIGWTADTGDTFRFELMKNSDASSYALRDEVGIVANLRTTSKEVVTGMNEMMLELDDIVHLTKTPKVYNSFANKPDGAINSLDSGQSFGIWNNGGNTSGLSIQNGKLVHGTPTSQNAAGYLEVLLDKIPTRMGASFIIPDVTKSGNVTLASFQTSILDGVNSDSAGIHCTVNPSGIELIIYQPGGSTSYGSVTFNSSLVSNVEYSFEIFIDGNTIYVVSPDGTISPAFTNPNVQSLSSNHAVFELYEYSTTFVPAQITNIWASDTPLIKDGNIITTYDLIKGLLPIKNSLTVDSKGVTASVTDCNKASQTGFYQCGTNAANAPTTDAYHLMTIQANINFMVQYATKMNDIATRYRRALYNGTWTGWVQVFEGGYSYTITDLNNANVSGYYQCGTNATNAPTTDAFHIIVAAANTNEIVQTVYRMSNAAVRYKRYKDNGTWGAWSQCFETVSEMNTFLPIQSNGDALTVTDLNNANKSGFYQCNTNTTNSPSATFAFFIQAISANATYKMQYAWQMNDITKKYKRAMYNGTWNAWVACTE